ncbi:MAG: hypothetical protein IPL35_04785 [Sphingobacteriales bacterium]|nr:hypothetical protein [Sphingobacteriales bacterium]
MVWCFWCLPHFRRSVHGQHYVTDYPKKQHRRQPSPAVNKYSDHDLYLHAEWWTMAYSDLDE